MTSEGLVLFIMMGLFAVVALIGLVFHWVYTGFYKMRERKYRKLYPDYFKALEDYYKCGEEYANICREIHRLKAYIETDTADLIYYTEDKIADAMTNLENLKTELAVIRGAKFRKDEERTILREYTQKLRKKYNIKNF